MITTYATLENWKKHHTRPNIKNCVLTKFQKLCLIKNFLYHQIKNWQMFKTIINLFLENLNFM
jgi:hypothetical protein